ncbi:LPXTG cell wall anchor domain-containing protein, partial [Enterococcus faecalis]|uniref:LPXTG cell wall anchor domain-containing protein n=4 Tax=Enterococcus TaxID=1350 RepID=UPI0025AF5816
KKTGGTTQSTTPVESTNKNQSTSSKEPVAQKQEVAKKAKGNLPKTGVKMSYVWMILGILILASAIYG